MTSKNAKKLFYKKRVTRVKNRIIKKILNNKIIREMTPFLLFSDEFDQCGFDVVDTLFGVAFEIIPQLEHFENRRTSTYASISTSRNESTTTFHSIYFSPIVNDHYFLWNVSKRYFYEFESYFKFEVLGNYSELFVKMIKSRKSFKTYNQFSDNLESDKGSTSKTNYITMHSKEMREKMIIFRLLMYNLLGKLIAFDKRNLINDYNKWHKAYLEIDKNNVYWKQVIGSDEFVKLINL